MKSLRAILSGLKVSLTCQLAWNTISHNKYFDIFQEGPGVADMISILGKETTIQRINAKIKS